MGLYYAILFGVVAYLVLNTVASIRVAVRARSKGRSFAGFFWVGFFGSVLLSFIIVLIISPTDEARMRFVTDSGQAVGPVSCPFCKELIRPDANVCKHCGKEVEAALGTILAERRALAESAAKREVERAEELTQARTEARARRMAWLARPLVRVGLIFVAVILVMAIAAPSILSAVNQASQNQYRESLISKYGAWSTLAASCNEAPEGVSNLAVPDSNLSIEFEIDVLIKPLRSASQNLTDEQALFLECLGSGLGEFGTSGTSNEQVFIPGVQVFMDNGGVTLMRKFSELVSETISQGTFVGSAEIATVGYAIEITGPSHIENTEMSGTWHVKVTKSPDYGSSGSN